MLAFAHAGLFWTGLGLVAVPILIHFFFRRRHRVVRWAAMDFLLAALRKQKRRMEIENLILLLLRCAAIVLLAVAVARPAWNAPALPFGGSARGVVLVVDTSASMGALFTGRSSFDRAKERAAQFLTELPEGSQVTLVASRDETAGGGPRALLENADRGDARAALAGVRLSHGANRLEAVVTLAREKLSALRGRQLIVFVTDLQRRDWYGDTDTRRAGLYDKLRLVEPGATAPPVVLVDVGQAETANVAVQGLAAEEGRGAFPGKRVEITARLVNYGPAAVQGTLTLQVALPGDGPWEKAGAVEVTVPPPLGVGPPEPVACEFMPRVPAKGEGSVRFRALFTSRADAGDRDRLSTDSERLLALPVRPPVRILPVRTFSTALELLEDVELVQVIELLQPIYPQDLLAYDLSGVDIVLWADPETQALAAEDVAKLEAFVRRGGGFLAYFGQFADAGQLSAFVEGKVDPLLPARIGEKRFDKDHPILIDRDDEHTQAHALFKETNQPLFFSPDVYGYVEVSGYAPDAVVAKYTNGDPAVLEKRYGRGRVVMVTTTPDARFFALNGSLLPAVVFYNATQYLVWESPTRRNVTVGDPVDVILPAGAREVEVTPPASAGGPSREEVAEGTLEFQLTDTSAPGFYRVVARGAGGAAMPAESAMDAAVNVDPEEGDLRRATPEELKRTYQGAPLEFADEGEQVLRHTARTDEGESSRAFLGAVVALLFVELLCAWRFGSRRRPNA
jgi:hypothetical protein